jgi:hypothetical protein
MKTTTLILTMIALLLCSDLFAQTNGSISARSLVLTDGEGRKVTIIPQRDAPIGDYIFEVPLIPALASTGILGSQNQQAPNDNNPYVTFATGPTTLTNNRILAAGTGISLTTSNADNGNATIANTGVISLAGTANQVSVSASTGSVTLSLPQNIHSGASPTFTNVSLSSIPASSSYTNIVVSNGGALQTRTISSLGVVDEDEPILTFSSGGSTLTNNRVVAAGSGIGLATGGSDGSNFTISNTGLLSASAGSGISVGIAAGNATITNTGVLSNIAGSGISVSNASGNVTISNNGLLAATAGSGISVSTTAGNATITNAGVLSLTAGTGIALTNSTGNITVSNTGVTSVGLSMPGIFAVANSPVTTTGTLTVSLADQAPNTFLAGPVSGSNAAPGFRALDFADFDALVWTLQGNNVATGAYIGTTNSEPFDMRVNNSTRFILTDRVTVQRDNDGDLRGYYATDMQPVRALSNQVASGNYSTISGGRSNRASGIGSTIGGGGYDGDVVSGNIASGRATTVAGGHGNEASVDLASVGGGDYNTAGGYVTTISGGQFNIAGDYGATVAGGISNVASVELAFIGGGAENNASGVRSVIGGGQGNNAIGEYSTIIGGQGNTTTGVGSVAMGTGTIAQGSRSIALGGGVGASGDYSVAMGGFGNAMGNFSQSSGLNAAATKYGQSAHGSGAFGVIGDAQRSEYVLRNSTSDATVTNVYLDGISAALTIPSNTVFTFVADITALSSTGDAGSYQIKGAIKNIGGTTSIVGSITVTVNAEDQASWDVSAVADDGGDALVIQVQGDDATEIRWVASVRSTEVTY